jgi:hypothetical protein
MSSPFFTTWNGVAGHAKGSESRDQAAETLRADRKRPFGSDDAKPSQELTEPPLPMVNNGEGQTAMPPAGEASASSFRDERGRFRKGHKFARGNPFHRRTAALRRSISGVVSLQDVRELARTLYRAAMGGDMVAARLLLAYLVGRPERTVDPDAVDVEEWRLCQQKPVAYADVIRAWQCLPADFASKLLQRMWPAMMSDLTKGIEKIVAGEGPRKAGAEGPGPQAPGAGSVGPVSATSAKEGTDTPV